MKFTFKIKMKNAKVLHINPGNIENENEKLNLAAGLIREGKIIVYPTDTVYGIGCSIYSKNINKIFEIKKRTKKPMSVAFSCIEMLKGYVVMDARQEKFIKENLLKPYTFILKKKDNISDDITFGEKLGARIPDNEIVKKLIKNSFPVITTSANISGECAAASYDEISEEIKNNKNISLIIDSGKCKVGKPSVVVDLTGERFRVLRG